MIKIGEYIRTQNNVIGKVKKKVKNADSDGNVKRYVILDDENKSIISYDEIESHSEKLEELEN